MKEANVSVEEPSGINPSDLPLRNPRVWLAVACGGALGALLRFGWGQLIPAGASGFPWAIFTENVLGAFVLGWLVAVFMRQQGRHRYMRAFFGTGLVGSFTTFSGITADLAMFTLAGDVFNLVLYPMVSILLGLLAAFAGLKAGRVTRQNRDRRKNSFAF